ncbi:hypothetical protein M3I53_36135 [Paraburkholderia sp. CNPSo 3272]|nr:hypothetical protein [Paraburkholderia sp. CNPSo 3272]MCP3728477.1 hypothetical protein [Paraburkholderia sp. CNPSo 3272]
MAFVAAVSSRKIDLEFRAVSVQQVGKLSVDGFLYPDDEASPVIFEMFPDDLDQIELGTVWRQIEEERFVFNGLAIRRSVVDAVMDARVIEHDHGGFAVALLDQRFHTLDDMESLTVRACEASISAFLPKSSAPMIERLQWLLGSIAWGKPRGDQLR